MKSITITLPDPGVKTYVDQVVASGTYGSVEEYVVALIRADQKRRARARLEALLLEGLDGDPTPLQAQDWADMHRLHEERRTKASTS